MSTSCIYATPNTCLTQQLASCAANHGVVVCGMEVCRYGCEYIRQLANQKQCTNHLIIYRLTQCNDFNKFLDANIQFAGKVYR